MKLHKFNDEYADIINIPLFFAIKKWNETQQAGVSIASPDNGTILDYSLLLSEVKARYAPYVMPCITEKEELTDEEAAGLVFENFNTWKRKREKNIIRAFDALALEYDLSFNFERFEDARTVDSTTTHGKQTSAATDLKKGKSTDLKKSTNTGLKTSTATDLTSAVNTDLKNSANTEIKETELTSTHKESRPTWTSESASVLNEESTPGQKSTSGDAANNYTETKGTAANNYTETKGTAANNYTETSGSAETNYTLEKGAEELNYEHTSGSAESNFKKESGSTKRADEYGKVHIYGREGADEIDDILKELDLRRRDLISEIIAEFVNSYAYINREI